jgi:tRNA1Val (adenine37-N6)-methyltransferase
MNIQSQRAVARHEIRAALPDVIGAASRMLEISGRFAVIFPAERLVALLTGMRAARIEPKFLRMVHSRHDTGAKLALVEGMKGGRPGLAVAPALVIYRGDGRYTDEAAGMFRP